MANGIDEFKSKLTGGGARANMFNVIINYPAFVGGDSEQTSFMCKAAKFPGSQIEKIDVMYRGRKLPVPGDRTFEPWNITVMNDSEFSVRNSFETWSNGINNHNQNTGLVDPNDYSSDLIVQQLRRDGTVAKTVNIRGAWPSNVSEIEVSTESENTISEFTVDFEYSYWESNTTS
tara:strand:- start:110 stop:634 length:525 start_codon:yes stop_codon:yes gene_type:complete